MYTLNIHIDIYNMKMILFHFGNEKSIWINFILFLNKIIIDSMCETVKAKFYRDFRDVVNVSKSEDFAKIHGFS